LIGLGSAGINYLNLFSNCERAHVVAGADPSSDACARASKLAGELDCVADYHETLSRDDIDLVVVATPHNLHHAMVIGALEAGKHVLCEKPLAITTAECDAMIAAAKSAGRQLLAIQTQRSVAPFRLLKKALDENDMGAPLGCMAMYLGCEVDRMNDTNSWKGTLAQAGGGVLLDGGCHIIDLCNWYLGRPVRVVGQSRSPKDWHKHKGETTGSAMITYEGGATAQVLTSFESRLPGSYAEPTLRVAVELYYENGSAWAEYAYFGQYGLHRSAKYICGNDEQHELEIKDEHNVNYAEHIIACLLDGAEPLATPVESRMAIAVIEAAYNSARTGGQCVDVEPLPA